MYCAHSSEWGLFGRNTRSAIQGTSSSPPREERADIGKDDVVEPERDLLVGRGLQEETRTRV